MENNKKININQRNIDEAQIEIMKEIIYGTLEALKRREGIESVVNFILEIIKDVKNLDYESKHWGIMFLCEEKTKDLFKDEHKHQYNSLLKIALDTFYESVKIPLFEDEEDDR